MQSPSSVLVRTIAIDRELGPIAGKRRIHLDSIELYERKAFVNYRLRPGIDPDDDVRPFLGWLWEMEIEDDLGTEYYSNSGAYGGDATETEGSRDVQPAPPPEATEITLIVLDAPVKGRPKEVGRVTIPLS
jgi:hypothetical protein